MYIAIQMHIVDQWNSRAEKLVQTIQTEWLLNMLVTFNFTKYQDLQSCHSMLFGSRYIHGKSDDCSEVSNRLTFIVAYSSLRRSVWIPLFTYNKWQYLWVQSRSAGCKCDFSKMGSLKTEKCRSDWWISAGEDVRRKCSNTHLQHNRSLRKQYCTKQEQWRLYSIRINKTRTLIS